MRSSRSGGGWLEKDTKTHASRRIALDGETLRVLAEQRAFADELARLAVLHARKIATSLASSLTVCVRSCDICHSAIRTSTGYSRSDADSISRFSSFCCHPAYILRCLGSDGCRRLGHSNASMTLQVYSHLLQRLTGSGRTYWFARSNASTKRSPKPRPRSQTPVRLDSRCWRDDSAN